MGARLKRVPRRPEVQNLGEKDLSNPQFLDNNNGRRKVNSMSERDSTHIWESYLSHIYDLL